MKNRKNYEEMLEKLDTEISKKTQKNDEIDIQWLPLEPFDEIEIDSIASFPFAAMGELLGDAAKAISEGVQAPDALAGGSVLASASLAVQSIANVVLPHGQRAPLSLYIVTSGESGDRKSGVDRISCAPIERRRKAQARDYQRQMEAYSKSQVAGRKSNVDIAPPMQALTVGDATIQGIAKLLRAQSVVGIFSPDGGDVLGGHSMQDKNRMATMAFFLKAWGGESVDTLRSGDGMTSLLGRRIAMHVMVQPVLLSQLLEDPLASGQGFLARCLIAEPRSLAGTRLFCDINLEDEPCSAISKYQERLESLLSVAPNTWPEGDGYELKPRDLRLSFEAKAIWPELHNSFELQQATGSELEAARPFAAKAMEHLARIAGVLTLFNEPNAVEIGITELQGAAEIVSFYTNEHLRLTGLGRQYRQDQAAKKLLSWLQALASQHGGRVSKNEILQKSPRGIRELKAAGIAQLSDELQRRGYIRESGRFWEVRIDV